MTATIQTVGEKALARLVAIALRDTGQSRRVADFLLAWHNASENGGWNLAALARTARAKRMRASTSEERFVLTEPAPEGETLAAVSEDNDRHRCAGCEEAEPVSRGLCRSCYDAAYHDETYFSGNKRAVLERDGYCCRVCGVETDVVHHRKPGMDDQDWLITLCPRCHARVERSRFLRAYVSPLLAVLWREKHPDEPWQLQLGFEEEAA